MKNNIYKVKLGMKWCGWNAEQLAKELGVPEAEVDTALAGNGRASDRRLLARAEKVLQAELDRQCAELDAAYAGLAKMGEILRGV